MDRNEAMSWANQAIWWQVYPLGFSGAPIRDAHPSPAPRLRRLLGWLDYAVEMGVSGLLLGPIFASQTHGYDTVDHFRIDPRLGGDEDFDALVAACQGRGLRILLDGVFSHVGVEHPALSRVLAEGPESHDARLFDIDWNAAGGPAPEYLKGMPLWFASITALTRQLTTRWRQWSIGWPVGLTAGGSTPRIRWGRIFGCASCREFVPITPKRGFLEK